MYQGNKDQDIVNVSLHTQWTGKNRADDTIKFTLFFQEKAIVLYCNCILNWELLYQSMKQIYRNSFLLKVCICVILLLYLSFFFSLGNITDVKKAGGFSAFLRDNHKKYGPIFSFYWQKELCVSLASPELWKDVVALFDRPGKWFQENICFNWKIWS